MFNFVHCFSRKNNLTKTQYRHLRVMFLLCQYCFSYFGHWYLHIMIRGDRGKNFYSRSIKKRKMLQSASSSIKSAIFQHIRLLRIIRFISLSVTNNTLKLQRFCLYVDVKKSVFFLVFHAHKNSAPIVNVVKNHCHVKACNV